MEAGDKTKMMPLPSAESESESESESEAEAEAEVMKMKNAIATPPINQASQAQAAKYKMSSFGASASEQYIACSL